MFQATREGGATSTLLGRGVTPHRLAHVEMTPAETCCRPPAFSRSLTGQLPACHPSTMGADVILPVSMLCATVVYVLRGGGPLGRVLVSLADTLKHRAAHERHVFEHVKRESAAEREIIQRDLDATAGRLDRFDARLRALERGGDV